MATFESSSTHTNSWSGSRCNYLVEHRPRAIRNRHPFHNRSRVALDQRFSILCTHNFCCHGASGGEIRDTALCIVRVGGEDVDGGAVEQPAGDEFGELSPEPRE